MKRMMILCLSLLCLLSACQPTPEQPFVIQNDQEKMIETAQKVEAIPEQPAAEAVDLYERLGAPRTFQKQLSGTVGRLIVDVDAQVILPENELPIIRVEPERSLSKEKLLQFADALLPQGAEFVEPQVLEVNEEKTYYLRSKAWYVPTIQLMQWAIEHWDEGGSALFDNDDSTKADVEKRLAETLVQQSLAPEKMPRVSREELTLESMMGWWQATVDDATLSSLLVAANPWDGTVDRIEYIRNDHDNPNVIYKNRIPNDLDYRTAEAAAIELVNRLPIGDFALSAAWPEKYDLYGDGTEPCWRFFFGRAYGSARETITNAECTRDEGYNHQRDYEKLLVTVDKDGVAGVRYDAPYSVMETLAERTNLMPFSKIEEIFDKMILVYDNNLNDGTRDKTYMTYHIQRVELGLVNIPEKNSENGLLVPAWTFLGYAHVESPYDGVVDWATNGLKPFLTINAVDGSIINREGD